VVMSEQDGPWAAWRSLNGSKENSAESYAKKHPAERQRIRRNRYGIPRYKRNAVFSGKCFSRLNKSQFDDLCMDNGTGLCSWYTDLLLRRTTTSDN